MKNIHKIRENIYITNDEEIKKGEWVLFMFDEVTEIVKVTTINNNAFESKQGFGYGLEYCKKIILTTDKDLIKDGVQAIDDEFLEWFVNNPSCECVDVQKWASLAECGYSYHIIIPQEVPNLTDEKGRPMTYWGGLVETKQEALEEAYQRGYERGLNALIPLIENIQSEITKLKRNL